MNKVALRATWAFILVALVALVALGANDAGNPLVAVVKLAAPDYAAETGNKKYLTLNTSGELRVISSAAAGGMVVDTELPAASALADDDANPTTSRIGANLLAWDGATWDRVANGGGVEAPALRVTLANDSTGLVSVDDNAGSLTVDNATLSTTGGGVEAGALRVTVANDSTGVLSVDDNGGNLSVDWAGTPPPVGAGTEAAALRVTLATDSTGVVSVDDNAGSLTVDNAALAVTGGGVEASALRVTVASDSTGVLSVDDNAGSLTVDGTVSVDNVTTSVTPGTAAGNLGKAEDGVHSSGDTGVAVLGVANSDGTDLAAVGDYTPIGVTVDGAVKTTNAPDTFTTSSGQVLTVTRYYETNALNNSRAEIVAAQGAGNSIAVIGWQISASVAGTIELESDGGGAGDNTIAEVYNATSWTSDYDAIWHETDDDESLELFFSGNGNVSITLRYVVR